jgi:hypothetical protein
VSDVENISSASCTRSLARFRLRDSFLAVCLSVWLCAHSSKQALTARVLERDIGYMSKVLRVLLLPPEGSDHKKVRHKRRADLVNDLRLNHADQLRRRRQQTVVSGGDFESDIAVALIASVAVPHACCAKRLLALASTGEKKEERRDDGTASGGVSEAARPHAPHRRPCRPARGRGTGT